MAKFVHCCLFLLMTILAALYTAAEIISKSVCEGDSVKIFQNISSASFKIKITLYKIGAGKQELIAIWFVNHSSTEDIIQDKYKPKVLFENGTIMLRNIKLTDEATYVLLYDIDGWSERKEMQISALVPPSNPCKPKIRQEDNVLIALLDNQEYCGKPLVSVEWMEYPGISYKVDYLAGTIWDKAVIEVPPGKDSCTYYACIEGEALTCTRKSAEKEYCEHITVGSTKRESIPVPSYDIPQLQTINVVIAVIVLLVLLVVIASPIIMWKYCIIVPRVPERARSDEVRRDRRSLLNRTVIGQYNHEPRRDDHERELLSHHENIEMQIMH